MQLEDFEREFLAMPDKEQMRVVRRIMPAFCRKMMRDPENVQEMFSLFTKECGKPMTNMISMMERTGSRRGSCCE